MALVLLSLPVAADTITGRVVDSNGAGVPNVNIDAEDLVTGNNPTLFNDGTDPGGFFTTTIPPGVYRITFIPPPPPTTTLLVVEVQPVTVVGTTNMGTIVLPPGVSLSGHVQRTNGTPVAGVDLDVIELASGTNLVLQNGVTDAFGNFSIAVPAAPIELRLDASSVAGPLASLALQLAPTGNTTLPPLVLPPGFVLSGTVIDSGGDPVEDADLDVFDAATSEELYTPNDSTDNNGDFSIVVPAGTFDLAICPDPSDLLVATGIADLVVTTNLDLGTFTLEPGAVLSGTVRDASAQPVAGVDVDVVRSATQAKVYVCGDSTDSQGQYSVVVPFTTIDARFTPDFSLPLGTAMAKNLVITGARTQNATLPNCPFAANYGTGLAGTGSLVPILTSSGGAPSVSNGSWRLELQNGRGGSLAILILSTSSAAIPFRGGTILVGVGAGQHINLFVMLSGAPGAPGAGAFTLDPGDISGLVGFTAFAQFAVQDPVAVQGWAMSRGLQMTFCN